MPPAKEFYVSFTEVATKLKYVTCEASCKAELIIMSHRCLQSSERKEKEVHLENILDSGQIDFENVGICCLITEHYSFLPLTTTQKFQNARFKFIAEFES